MLELQDHEEKNLQNIFPSPISPVLASSIILAMTPSTYDDNITG